MRVRVNPELLLATDSSTAVSRRTGGFFAFTSTQRQRISAVRSHPDAALEASDVPLLRDSVLMLTEAAELLRSDTADEVRRQWQESGQLVVMPTERCNLRCSYCYQDFQKPGMRPDLVAGVMQYLERTLPEHSTFDLAWFGGEPLMQVATVERVTTHFTRLQQQHAVRGSVSVTTNGYGLTDPVVGRLAEAGVGVYQITVDGPSEVHDSQRRHINGAGTYARILGNVDRVLAACAAKVVLRVNVDTERAESATTIRRWLDEEIFPRYSAHGSRFEVHVVPIWEADTTSIDGICLTELSRFLVWADVLAAAVDGNDCGTWFVAALRQLGGLACYAGRPNSYVVGADGTVYKCTVALDLPENQVGTLGADGTLTLDRDRERVWTGQSLLTDGTCASCAFSRSCQGLFCPLLRLQTGSQPCPTEKRFADYFLHALERG